LQQQLHTHHTEPIGKTLSLYKVINEKSTLYNVFVNTLNKGFKTTVNINGFKEFEINLNNYMIIPTRFFSRLKNHYRNKSQNGLFKKLNKQIQVDDEFDINNHLEREFLEDQINFCKYYTNFIFNLKLIMRESISVINRIEKSNLIPQHKDELISIILKTIFHQYLMVNYSKDPIIERRIMLAAMVDNHEEGKVTGMFQVDYYLKDLPSPTELEEAFGKRKKLIYEIMGEC